YSTGSQAEADDELERLYPCSHGGVGGDRLSMAVEKGAKTAVVWLLFTLPLSLLEGVFSQNGPQRSRARRCCAAKRTLHGEDRSEILDKRERGGPKWTAKMAQSLTASDKPGSMSCSSARASSRPVEWTRRNISTG